MAKENELLLRKRPMSEEDEKDKKNSSIDSQKEKKIQLTKDEFDDLYDNAHEDAEEASQRLNNKSRSKNPEKFKELYARDTIRTQIDLLRENPKKLEEWRSKKKGKSNNDELSR